MDSNQLLQDYAEHGSDAAFGELVERYIDLVYSVALRRVGGDPHLAQDVVQIVFADLARKAHSLPAKLMVGGWLHRHCCFVASNLLRSARCRQAYEQQAGETNSLQGNTDALWAHLAPDLDDAINRLGTRDRLAIVLRFFEGCDFRAVGQALGLSEDAAQKRVARALEKLHVMLKGRGVSLSAAALVAALASQAVAAAPAGLAVHVAASAVSAAAAAGGSGLVTTFLNSILMNKLFTAIIGAVAVALLATPLVFRHEDRAKLREKDELLQQQTDQLARLTPENLRLSNLLAQASGLRDSDSQHELLRLRGEVGLLRQQTNELARQLQALLAKAGQTALPPQGDAAVEPGRQSATAAKQLCLALRMYAHEHQDQLPSGLTDELVPYVMDKYQKPADFVQLAGQFELVYRGSINLSNINHLNPGSVLLLRERQPWRTADGQWAKNYGCVDGSVERHAEPDGNFDAWEKRRLVPVPEAAAPGQ
jgi:RNA polymerase sigma factor (sigma-70 family)